MAERITVEWMTVVPYDEALQSNDYDRAEWDCARCPSKAAARVRARKELKRNAHGQVWIKTERAPSEDSPSWMWETDHGATETLPS